VPGGSRPDSLDPLQHGLHYAVVCQNNDPEQLNRVKVRLPWLDGGDTDQTHWAQLMTPMAGDRFGVYALPDLDDVVVVMFIAGDMSQPVIVGGVWSTPDFSPEPNEDGKNNFRGYRSRSGHRLILDDSEQVKVVVADKTAMHVIGLGRFAKAGAGPNVCAVYKPPMAGDSGVAFSAMEGTVELTCPDGNLKVQAGGSVMINAKSTLDLKAGGDVKLEGSSSAKVSSGSSISHEAGKTNLG
jgi:phage baseplate assembly protein gpV